MSAGRDASRPSPSRWLAACRLPGRRPATEARPDAALAFVAWARRDVLRRSTVSARQLAAARRAGRRRPLPRKRAAWSSRAKASDPAPQAPAGSRSGRASRRSRSPTRTSSCGSIGSPPTSCRGGTCRMGIPQPLLEAITELRGPMRHDERARPRCSSGWSLPMPIRGTRVPRDAVRAGSRGVRCRPTGPRRERRDDPRLRPAPLWRSGSRSTATRRARMPACTSAGSRTSPGTRAASLVLAWVLQPRSLGAGRASARYSPRSRRAPAAAGSRPSAAIRQWAPEPRRSTQDTRSSAFAAARPTCSESLTRGWQQQSGTCRYWRGSLFAGSVRGRYECGLGAPALLVRARGRRRAGTRGPTRSACCSRSPTGSTRPSRA